MMVRGGGACAACQNSSEQLLGWRCIGLGLVAWIAALYFVCSALHLANLRVAWINLEVTHLTALVCSYYCLLLLPLSCL
jgi:hypothetical protein